MLSGKIECKVRSCGIHLMGCRCTVLEYSRVC